MRAVAQIIFELASVEDLAGDADTMEAGGARVELEESANFFVEGEDGVAKADDGIAEADGARADAAGLVVARGEDCAADAHIFVGKGMEGVARTGRVWVGHEGDAEVAFRQEEHKGAVVRFGDEGFDFDVLAIHAVVVEAFPGGANGIGQCAATEVFGGAANDHGGEGAALGGAFDFDIVSDAKGLTGVGLLEVENVNAAGGVLNHAAVCVARGDDAANADGLFGSGLLGFEGVDFCGGGEEHVVGFRREKVDRVCIGEEEASRRGKAIGRVGGFESSSDADVTVQKMGEREVGGVREFCDDARATGSDFEDNFVSAFTRECDFAFEAGVE